MFNLMGGTLSALIFGLKGVTLGEVGDVEGGDAGSLNGDLATLRGEAALLLGAGTGSAMTTSAMTTSAMTTSAMSTSAMS